MSRVSKYRDEYRAANIGPRYSGPAHFVFTTGVSFAIIGYCASRVSHPTWLELLTIPLTFLFANFSEYVGHRFSMHRPRIPAFIYRRHTLEHHRFFEATPEAMAYDSPRDWKAVLFPAPVVVFFFGGFGAPVGVLLALVASANIAWLFVATALAYFITYEWLHFSYHMAEDSWVGRIGIVRVLRRHHMQHHDPALMGKYNFNITFPIFDYLLKTTAPPRVPTGMRESREP